VELITAGFEVFSCAAGAIVLTLALAAPCRFAQATSRQRRVRRAEAMAYRDARGQAMAEQDWSDIGGRMLPPYRLLKATIERGVPA